MINACDCHIHVYDNRYPTAAGATLFPANASIEQYRDEVQAVTGTTRAVLVTPSTYGTDNRSMLDGLRVMGNAARAVAVIDGTENDTELEALNAAALPHIKSGGLRALAVTSAEPLDTLPDVPTMKKEGIDDFVVEQWQAVFAPAGTPSDTVQNINLAIADTLKTPTITTLAEKLGITLVGGTPADLDKTRNADYDNWGDVIKQANIKNQ